MHHASLLDLILAHDRDVILGLTGDQASRATNALAEVNGHAPLMLVLEVETLVRWLAVILLLTELTFIEAHRRWDMTIDAGRLREGRVLLQRLGGAFAIHAASFHRVVLLGDGELVSIREHFYLRAGQHKLIEFTLKLVTVETREVADVAGAILTVAKGDRDRVRHMARRFNRWNFEDTVTNRDANLVHQILEHVSIIDLALAGTKYSIDDAITLAGGECRFQAERFVGYGADQRRIVPGQLADRIGRFLQPSIVDEAAIVNAAVRHQHDFGGNSCEGRSSLGLDYEFSNASDIHSHSGRLASATLQETITQGVVPLHFVQTASS